MKEFKSVSWYTKMLVPVYFPEDDVACIHCPMLREEFTGSYKRYFCKRTGEIIIAPMHGRGRGCPGEIKEDINFGTGEVKEAAE